MTIKCFPRNATSTQSWKRYAWCSFCIAQVLVFTVAATRPAHAYVDPGSGLLIFQVGGSMLAGALFALRSKIRKLFRMGQPAADPASPAAVSASDEPIHDEPGSQA